MREIRTLRAMRRELETEPRRVLFGHEGGNPGHSQGRSYGPPRQFPTLPREKSASVISAQALSRGGVYQLPLNGSVSEVR